MVHYLLLIHYHHPKLVFKECMNQFFDNAQNQTIP